MKRSVMRLMVLLAIQMAVAPDEYAMNSCSLLSMSFGLMVATMASMAKGELSFFNVLVVLNLLWCVPHDMHRKPHC